MAFNGVDFKGCIFDWMRYDLRWAVTARLRWIND